MAVHTELEQYGAAVVQAMPHAPQLVPSAAKFTQD